MSAPQIYYSRDFSNSAAEFASFKAWCNDTTGTVPNPFPEGYGQPGDRYADFPLDVLLLLETKRKIEAAQVNNAVDLSLHAQATEILARAKRNRYSRGFSRTLGGVRMILATINKADATHAAQAAQAALANANNANAAQVAALRNNLATARANLATANANHEAALAAVSAERDAVRAERDNLVTFVGGISAERDAVRAERDNLVTFVGGIGAQFQAFGAILQNPQVLAAVAATGQMPALNGMQIPAINMNAGNGM